MYSCSGLFTPHLTELPPFHRGTPPSGRSPAAHEVPVESWACPAAARGEGQLHDARNLIGALDLYCDLLSMPDVLKPEHRHYTEELRLVGRRSRALIEGLMQSLMKQDGASCRSLARLPAGEHIAEPSVSQHGTVSLRAIVERNAGLSSRVAGGRSIEIVHGPAAMAPVAVQEEAVERILVNLVRNATAALANHTAAPGSAGSPTPRRSGCAVEHEGSIPMREPTSDEAQGSIRIGVGLLGDGAGPTRPWPFQRVRLTVEDSGQGMSPEQVERLLSGVRDHARGMHGIGFRVVREMVATSKGDLSVMSRPGLGTRVQIEWPMAAPGSGEATGYGRDPLVVSSVEDLCCDRMGGMKPVRRPPGRSEPKLRNVSEIKSSDRRRASC